MPEKLSSERIRKALEDIVSSVSQKLGLKEEDIRLYGLEPDEIAGLWEDKKGFVYMTLIPGKNTSEEKLGGLKGIVTEILSRHNLGITGLTDEGRGRVVTYFPAQTKEEYTITLGFRGAPVISEEHYSPHRDYPTGGISEMLRYLEKFREDGDFVVDCDMSEGMLEALSWATRAKRAGSKVMYSPSGREYHLK